MKTFRNLFLGLAVLGPLSMWAARPAQTQATPTAFERIKVPRHSQIRAQDMVNITDEVSVSGMTSHVAYTVPADKYLVIQSIVAFKRSGGPGILPSNADEAFTINITHSGTDEVVDYTIMEHLGGHYVAPQPGFVLPPGATLELRHETWLSSYLLRYQFLGYLTDA